MIHRRLIAISKEAGDSTMKKEVLKIQVICTDIFSNMHVLDDIYTCLVRYTFIHVYMDKVITAALSFSLGRNVYLTR